LVWKTEEKICGIINYDAIFVSGAQFAKRRATWRRRIKYTVSMIFSIFLGFDSTYYKIQIYPAKPIVQLKINWVSW
jgi:hypothetical protein